MLRTSLIGCKIELMARIATDGWQHQTDTFVTIKADVKSFERADESGLSQSRECSRTATRNPTLTVCKQPTRGRWGRVQAVKNGVFGRSGGSTRMLGRRARRPDGRA